MGYILNFSYEKIMEKINQHGGYSFGYGAIFIAHRDQIRKYSKEYWQRLYDSLQEILPGSGWRCEKLWIFLLEEQLNTKFIYILWNKV